MPLSKAIEPVAQPRPVSLLLAKGCNSSMGPPMMKPNNFPDLTRQVLNNITVPNLNKKVSRLSFRSFVLYLTKFPSFYSTVYMALFLQLEAVTKLHCEAIAFWAKAYTHNRITQENASNEITMDNLIGFKKNGLCYLPSAICS